MTYNQINSEDISTNSVTSTETVFYEDGSKLQRLQTFPIESDDQEDHWNQIRMEESDSFWRSTEILLTATKPNTYGSEHPCLYVIDDNNTVRESLQAVTSNVVKESLICDDVITVSFDVIDDTSATDDVTTMCGYVDKEREDNVGTGIGEKENLVSYTKPMKEVIFDENLTSQNANSSDEFNRYSITCDESMLLQSSDMKHLPSETGDLRDHYFFPSETGHSSNLELLKCDTGHSPDLELLPCDTGQDMQRIDSEAIDLDSRCISEHEDGDIFVIDDTEDSDIDDSIRSYWKPVMKRDPCPIKEHLQLSLEEVSYNIHGAPIS